VADPELKVVGPQFVLLALPAFLPAIFSFFSPKIRGEGSGPPGPLP